MQQEALGYPAIIFESLITIHRRTCIMTNYEDKMDYIKNTLCEQALDVLIQIRNELEELGNQKDVDKFVRIVDAVDEWSRGLDTELQKVLV